MEQVSASDVVSAVMLYRAKLQCAIGRTSRTEDDVIDPGVSVALRVGECTICRLANMRRHRRIPECRACGSRASDGRDRPSLPQARPPGIRL